MYNFQRRESFEPPNSTPGEDRHMRSRTFLYEFNFEQLSFKTFFDALRIFGMVEPQTESISPFLYIIIFQRWESFEPPSSTPWEDRHMHSWIFLYEI